MAEIVVSADVMGEILGLTARRVRQMSDTEKIIPKLDGGKYDVGPCVRAYILAVRGKARNGKPISGAGGEPQGDSPQEETAKNRILLARASLAEMDVEREKGRLLDVADVEAAWAAMVLNMRSRLLALPSSGAARVLGLATMTEATAVLENMVAEALDELAGQSIGAASPHPGIAGGGERGGTGDEAMPAATETDG